MILAQEEAEMRRIIVIMPMTLAHQFASQVLDVSAEAEAILGLQFLSP